MLAVAQGEGVPQDDDEIQDAEPDVWGVATWPRPCNLLFDSGYAGSGNKQILQGKIGIAGQVAPPASSDRLRPAG